MARSTQEVLALQAHIQQLEAENQRLQASLHQQNRTTEDIKSGVLRDLLNNLSHDIRTPLSNIKTSIYLLRKAMDEAKRDRYLDVLQEEADHLELLVEDICSLTRLDNRATIFEIRRSNINLILETILERYTAQIREQSHTVACRLASELPPVMIDEGKIARAFSYLIENAIHYTPKGGIITVSSSLYDGRVVVEIIDNGAGISQEALPHIFDTFYREDKARSTSTGRAGLGLAIAHRIIENHNGKIEVESEVGVGSCFRILLPALVRTPA